MTFQVADGVIPLFFVSALVLMLKFRRQIQAEDKESYKYISAGLILLAVASVSRVYFVEGYFSDVPFLSDALFFRITSWIVIITGTTFIVSGLATWLPIARRGRQDQDRHLSRLEFLKRIERLSAIEARPETLLSGALDLMHQFCGVQRGFVYRYSSTRELLVLTGSTPGAFAGRQFHSSLPLRNSEVEQFSAGTTCPVDRLFANPGGLIDGPDQVIPLMVDGAYAGFFLLWGDELLTGNTETIQNLRLGIDVLARRISASRLRLQADYMIRRNRLQEAVKAIAASTVNSQEKVAGVLRQIRTSISAETAALWIVEENQEFGTRFTVGGTGALLLEKGLPVPASLRTLSEERTRSRALVFEGANEEHSEFLRGAIGPQYQAGLVAPMGHAQPAASFLVAGYVRADEFIRQSATLLTSVIPFMLDIVNSLAGPERAVPVDRRLVLIERLLSSFRRTGDIDRLLERSSELLIHMTSVDAVRIVTVDPHGPYAISRGFAASVPLEPMIPERGAMVRTLMPCFQAALQTGRTICAGSDDREFSMSSAESRQLFDETIRAVAIVPIAGSQGLCGAVCLGQTDVPATFTRRRLQPVRTLALGLGLALEAASHENSLAETMTVGRPIPVGLREDLDLRSRVKSSLSGIFGSVELLKAQQESVDPQTERYLTIIDRSAKRINEYLGPQDVRTYTR